MYISAFTLGQFTWATYLSQRITVKSSAVSNMLTASIIMTVICESFCHLLSGKSKLSLNTEQFLSHEVASYSPLSIGFQRCKEMILSLSMTR